MSITPLRQPLQEVISCDTREGRVSDGVSAAVSSDHEDGRASRKQAHRGTGPGSRFRHFHVHVISALACLAGRGTPGRVNATVREHPDHRRQPDPFLTVKPYDRVIDRAGATILAKTPPRRGTPRLDEPARDQTTLCARNRLAEEARSPGGVRIPVNVSRSRRPVHEAPFPADDCQAVVHPREPRQSSGGRSPGLAEARPSRPATGRKSLPRGWGTRILTRERSTGRDAQHSPSSLPRDASRRQTPTGL